MSSPNPSPLLDPDLLIKLERLAIQAKAVLSGKHRGERRSRRRGDSVEFADHRNYIPGDDLRFVDWNIYGRLDRLFLKLFFEEEDLCLHLLVDTSESMGFGEPSKFSLAGKIAAALGAVVLFSQDQVQVLTFSSDIIATNAPKKHRGRKAIPQLFDSLQNVRCDGRTRLASSVEQFLRANPRPGVVVMISDFLDRDGLEPVFQRLATGSHEISLIQILAAEELNPPIRGHLTLVDAEEEDRVDISVNAAVLMRYKKVLAEFIGKTREHANRRGFRFVTVQSDETVESVLLKTLRVQGMVR